METHTPFLATCLFPQFKSYYVVWKLFDTFRTQTFPWKFKSYYVVWKLYDFNDLIIRHYRFKSYYVVWKPNDKYEKYELEASLNRTM